MLIVTRGCSGAGKSRAAVAWVAEDPRRRCRVNSDRIGEMLHGVAFSGESDCEAAIRVVKLASIRGLLAAGFDVVTDDMYILEEKFAEVRQIVDDLNVDMIVWDMRDTPVETCIDHDSKRRRVVGEIEIRRQYALMLALTSDS